MLLSFRPWAFYPLEVMQRSRDWLFGFLGFFFLG